MKTYFLRLTVLLLVVAPAVAAAQSNILSAFDAIIQCKEAKITERHNLDKDPSTNVKTGQYDIYNFELPVDKMNLVKNVVKAIKKDSEKSYSFNSGKTLPGESPIAVAVGLDGTTSVSISEPGYDYLYALFLAPSQENPDGIYRYAYGMSYQEKNGRITGKLIITYSTTLKHRQELAKSDSPLVFQKGTFFVPGENTQPSWFEQVMQCYQTMATIGKEGGSRLRLATKAYSLIQNVSQYPEVTQADKTTVQEVLKVMISDKKYSDPVLNRLLTRSLATLE